MLTMIVAPSGYGKTYKIIERINEILDNESDKKIYVIVPEQETVKMESELLVRCGNRINVNLEIINFTRLANRVFREAGGMTYKYIDKSGKDLLTAVILERMKSACPAFANAADDVKYIQLLRSEMDALRNRGFHSDDIERVREMLVEEDRGGAALSGKLSDFASIFATYEKALSDKISDTTDDVNRLADTLDEFDFFENSYVFIDGFYDYTAPQYKVIEKIMRSCEGLYMTFSLALPVNKEVFRKTGEAYDRIRECAEKNDIEYQTVELETNYRTKNEALKTLSEAIIYDTELKAKSCDGVTITAVDTPYKECIYVAREIVKLVKSGVSLSEIALTSSNIASYASDIDNIFASYGIPHLNCTEKSPLQMPIVSHILSALDVVNSSFYYENLKSYLKSPYAPIDEDEAYILENYLNMWRLKKKDWYSDKDWTLHPRGYVENFSVADTAELETVNRARHKLFPTLKLIADGFSERSTVRRKAESIVEYFDALNLSKKVEEYNKLQADEQSDSEYDDEIRAWNILLDSLDMLVESAGELNVGRDRFIKYLRLILSDVSFGKIPSSLEEVELGDIEFVRSKNIKHFFFIGFNDGVFPGIEESKSIFTESERKWLIGHDLKLDDSNEDKLRDQNFQFLLTVLRPSDSLNLVYHTSSSESSKAISLPSYFASSIKDTLGVEPREYQDKLERPITRDELIEYLVSAENDLSPLFESEEERKLYEGAMKIKEFASLATKPFHLEEAEKIIPTEYRMTQSRLEKYEKCRFSYFVEYMLKARVRRKAEFASAEIGSYVHKILEIVLKSFSENGKDITEASLDDIEKITRESAREYIEKTAPNINEDSPKYKYLVENICSFVLLVVDNIKAEFSSSLFRPKYFEEDIGNSEAVKPYSVKLSDGGVLWFSGVIDRVDSYISGDGVEYIRVVDYKTKTGGKSFSLEDVLNGMNLQMLIYLYAFTNTPAEIPRREAGIMYMPASKKELEASDVELDDDVQLELMHKNLKRSGMYLDDRAIIDAMEMGEEKRFVNLKLDKKSDTYVGTSTSTLATLEEFGIIQRYIDCIFEDVMRNLKSGNIEANPIEDDSAGGNVCSYCPYHPICRYEGDIRERIKSKTPLEDIKKRLEEEKKTH